MRAVVVGAIDCGRLGDLRKALAIQYPLSVRKLLLNGIRPRRT
jgi:hypothetical protein